MTAAEPSQPTAVDYRELLGLLGNDRRCMVIEVVARMDADVIDTSELTERVAALQYGDQYTKSDRKRVYVSVYQTHIPQLREADVLAGEMHKIRPGENFERTVDLLDTARCQFGREPIRERTLRERLLGGMV